MIEYQAKAFARPDINVCRTLLLGNPNIEVSKPSAVMITIMRRFESGRIACSMSKGAKALAPQPDLGVRVAYPNSVKVTGIIDRACA